MDDIPPVSELMKVNAESNYTLDYLLLDFSIIYHHLPSKISVETIPVLTILGIDNEMILDNQTILEHMDMAIIEIIVNNIIGYNSDCDLLSDELSTMLYKYYGVYPDIIDVGLLAYVAHITAVLKLAMGKHNFEHVDANSITDITVVDKFYTIEPFEFFMMGGKTNAKLVIKLYNRS